MIFRSLIPLTAATMLLVGCGEQSSETAEPLALDTLEQRFSYGVAMNMLERLKADGVSIDYQAFAAAAQDAQSGTDYRLDQAALQTTFQEFQEVQNAKRKQEVAKISEENKAAGKTFLAANAKEEDVITLPSGLQYKILEAGSGPKPTASDTVTVHYRGTLLDGTQFDSSYDRGQPATFPVTGVIPGWTEALQLMEEGAKWMLYIPSSLAYGPGGTGREIGPNATLIFEVELLKAKQ